MWYTHFNNQQNKAWTKNLRDILDQAKKSIDANNYERPTRTLAVTLKKPTGEVNAYVHFEYSPQIIWYHTQGKVSGSVNGDLINANKQVNNEWRKYYI